MDGFLLVLDLDGTLVDSAADLRAALNQTLRERGRPPLSLAQVRPMIGDGVPALVARALAAIRADPAGLTGALPRFIELYEADPVRLTRPYPAVPETLAALRRRGYRTAICTKSRSARPSRCWKASGCCRCSTGSPAVIAFGSESPIRVICWN